MSEFLALIFAFLAIILSLLFAFSNHMDRIIRLGTGVATVILAMATAYLAWDADRQIGIMENDQRPWIKVETEIAGPFDFHAGGLANLPLRFTLTNVGKSPAFNIRLGAWGYLIFPGHNDPHKEQAQRCEWLRGQPLDNPARGSTLFPGDRVPWDQLGGAFTSGIGFTQDEILKGVVEENGLGRLNISFFGCADYVFGASRRHHQTGFIYNLALVVPREGMQPGLTFSIVPQGNISQDHLRLFLSPSASGQTD